MAYTDRHAPDVVPLRRLLKRHAAEALLKEFKALLPGVDLALLSADGHLFAGEGEWPSVELAAALAQPADSPAMPFDNLLLYPLLAEAHLVGVLAARGLQPDSAGSMQKQVLHCLQYSLTLLLGQALETRRVAQETLERYREINLFYNIGQTIGACLDPEEIPSLVLTEASRVIQADASAVLLPLAEGKSELEVKARFGHTGYAEALPVLSHPLIAQIYQTGRPDLVMHGAFEALPGGMILCVPLKARDQMLGLVLLGRLKGQPAFTASDEKLVMALASQAAIALEKAWLHQQEIKRQRLEEELAVGRQIQLGLLPKSYPLVPGWEFAAIYQAAWQVGGDLYDFFELPGEPQRLGLVIADVSGKGVPAALFMAFSRTVIRTEAMSGHNPAVVLERANRLITQDNSSRLFVSAFYATLDTHSGQLVYANAGHNWPFWLRAATKELIELEVPGTVLGMFKTIELEEQEIEVAQGDMLLFHTDGVTEAMNMAGQMLGEERLRAILATDTEASAAQIQQAVVAELEEFTGGTPQSDDFTLFVVKRQKEV
jgi:serine phosphatase RsbU (regulator of sigma subunit)